MSAKVFISYSRHDGQEHTDRLVLYLDHMSQKSEVKYNIYYDQREHEGENWINWIRNQLYTTNLFIFVLSNGYLNSPICKWETMCAIESDQKLLPILIDRSIHVRTLPTWINQLDILNWTSDQESTFHKVHNWIVKNNNHVKKALGMYSFPSPPESSLQKIVDFLYSDTIFDADSIEGNLTELWRLSSNPNSPEIIEWCANRFVELPQITTDQRIRTQRIIDSLKHFSTESGNSSIEKETKGESIMALQTTIRTEQHIIYEMKEILQQYLDEHDTIITILELTKYTGLNRRRIHLLELATYLYKHQKLLTPSSPLSLAPDGSTLVSDLLSVIDAP